MDENKIKKLKRIIAKKCKNFLQKSDYPLSVPAVKPRLFMAVI